MHATPGRSRQLGQCRRRRAAGPRSSKTSALLVVLAATGASACGSAEGGEFEVGQQRQPVLGGYVDEATSGVVGLALFSTRHPLIGHCSGALIAPNLVLTARHCVTMTDPAQLEDVVCGDAQLGSAFSPGTLVVSPSTHRPTDPSDPSYIRGKRIFVAPGATDLCGYDLALVMLEDSFDPSEAEPLTPRIDEMAHNNEIFSATGYGLTQARRDASSGVRMRTDERSVMCTLSTCESFDWPVVDGKEWLSQDANICSGDSGGPALDADGRVIGVASRGPSTCDAAIYGDVAAWGEFIIDIGLVAARDGGYSPPHWTTGSSEPAMTFEVDPDALSPASDGPQLNDGDSLDPSDEDLEAEPSDDAPLQPGCSTADECDSGALAAESACSLAPMRRASHAPWSALVGFGIAAAAVMGRRRRR